MSIRLDLQAARRMLLHDLEDNRRGRLSPGQKAWMEARLAAHTSRGDLREDLAAGAVLKTRGEIRWKVWLPHPVFAMTSQNPSLRRSKVVAMAPVFAEEHAVRDDLCVLPGPYWLYVLPRSGMVMAVEVTEDARSAVSDACRQESFDVHGPLPVTAIHLRSYASALIQLQGVDDKSFAEYRRLTGERVIDGEVTDKCSAIAYQGSEPGELLTTRGVTIGGGTFAFRAHESLDHGFRYRAYLAGPGTPNYRFIPYRYILAIDVLAGEQPVSTETSVPVFSPRQRWVYSPNVWGAIACVVVTLICVGVSLQDALRHALGQAPPSGEAAEPGSPPPEPTKQVRDRPFFIARQTPVFARGSADAVVDPIVWGTLEAQACVARFNAKTGARGWMICSSNERLDETNRSAVIGDLLLVDDFERHLLGIDVATGKKRWSTALDERTMEFCLRSNGTVHVTLENRAGTYILDQETGKLTPSTRTYDCQHIWQSWRHGPLPGQDFAIDMTFAYTVIKTPVAIDGMLSEKLVKRDSSLVLLGYERPGLHVPMAGAVDPKGGVLWKRELPPANAGPADTGCPMAAVLGDRRLCAVYGTAKTLRVGCWDPATGGTLWDTPVARFADPHQLTWIGFTDRHLALLHSDVQARSNARGLSHVLELFDLANGAWLREIR